MVEMRLNSCVESCLWDQVSSDGMVGVLLKVLVRALQLDRSLADGKLLAKPGLPKLVTGITFLLTSWATYLNGIRLSIQIKGGLDNLFAALSMISPAVTEQVCEALEHVSLSPGKIDSILLFLLFSYKLFSLLFAYTLFFLLISSLINSS